MDDTEAINRTFELIALLEEQVPTCSKEDAMKIAMNSILVERLSAILDGLKSLENQLTFL